MNLHEAIGVLTGGAFGALIKDCLNDNEIEMPYFKGNKLYLGFIGSTLVGAFIGYVVDGTVLTALLAGYTGSSVITNLVFTGTKKADEQNNNVSKPETTKESDSPNS